MKLFFMSILTFGLLPTVVAEGLILAENGKANAVIVIADKPDLTPATYKTNEKIKGSKNKVHKYCSVKQIAEELARRLKDATGATFKIVSAKNAPEKGNLILVGTSELSKKYGFDGIKGLKPEEARIVAFKLGVAIYGEKVPANQRGAMVRSIRNLWAPKEIIEDGLMVDRGTSHALSIFLEKCVGYRFYHFHENELFKYQPELKKLEIANIYKYQ